MKEPNQRIAYESVYSARGRTASVEASRTLKLPHVAEYFEKLKRASQAKAERTAGEIISELEYSAFSNIADYLTIDKDGNMFFKDFGEISPGKLSAIHSIKTTKKTIKGKKGDKFETVEIVTTNFKLHNKIDSLHKLGLRFGIFPTRSVSSDDDKPLLPFEVVLNDDKKK
jgi:hypothetical protein